MEGGRGVGLGGEWRRMAWLGAEPGVGRMIDGML